MYIILFILSSNMSNHFNIIGIFCFVLMLSNECMAQGASELLMKCVLVVHALLLSCTVYYVCNCKVASRL